MSDERDADRAAGGEDADHADLLDELRRMSAVIDPVPHEAIAAARSAFAWRNLDAELAELTADTSVDAELAGVRGSGTPTLLTFEASDLTVEVEILDSAIGRRLFGQLIPPAPGEVEVRWSAGRTTVSADEVGRFSAEGIGQGPVSLRCTVGSDVVETDWFLA
jgi:hypothetical protein